MHQKKVLFIVSSTNQFQQFKSVSEELVGWKINFINSDHVYNKKIIEKLFNEKDTEFKTISNPTTKNITKIIRELSPSIIVIGNDFRYVESSFVDCAKNLKIPTLLIQDGIFSDEVPNGRSVKDFLGIPLKMLKFIFEKNLYSLSEKFDLIFFELRYKNPRTAYGVGNCDKVAVFGNDAKNRLIKKDVASEKIIVTGNPIFDQINKKSEFNLHEKLNIPKNKLLVVLFTQWFVESGIWEPYQREQLVSTVSKAVSSIPDAHLIIKIHPLNEQIIDYKNILKHIPHNEVTITKNTAVSDVINSSKVVMAIGSTTALESMILGKPVIILDLFQDDFTEFYKNSGCIFTTEPMLIQEELTKILNDEEYQLNIIQNYKEFLEEQVYKLDGRSSERIAGLIKDMTTI